MTCEEFYALNGKFKDKAGMTPSLLYSMLKHTLTCTSCYLAVKEFAATRTPDEVKADNTVAAAYIPAVLAHALYDEEAAK